MSNNQLPLFDIETDIPLTATGEQPPSKVERTMQKLEVGESFYVNLEDALKCASQPFSGVAENQFNRLRTRALNWARKIEPDKKFKTRRHGKDEGIRIWRIK
jgi:hypothetical protein